MAWWPSAPTGQRNYPGAHAQLLGEWTRASGELLRALVTVEGMQFFLSFGLATWLLFDYYGRGGEASVVLLLVYWALNLPVLGQEIALLARQYPAHRNVTLRLLEPLGALDETARHAHDQAGGLPAEDSRLPAEPLQRATGTRGVAITLEEVHVRVAGHTVLAGINLTIAPGSHVAIVEPSGAGKSSLVGTLLGWYRPASGEIRIDGVPLDSQRLAQLHHETAWVDPAVQLWNRSLLDNLSYGAPADPSLPIGQVIAQAHLRSILERLPDGLQTRLGEGAP